MLITRFLDDDGHVWLGEARGDGSATILLDAEGVLGESQGKLVSKELLRGKRVVVADDDPGIRRAVGAALERYDCRCTFCADGRSAVTAVADESVDLVVSDIVMPECDGYQVLAAAKALPTPPPVVLITGYGYDPGHRVVRAMDVGVDGILYKPFSPQQLIGRLTEAIRQNSDGARDTLVRTTRRLEIGRRLPPLAPRQILCAGRNARTGPAPSSDADLELFMKPLGAVQGPGKAIRLPSAATGEPNVWAEGELAVVIGRLARGVAVEHALECVLGYTLALDVTARRWQRDDVPMAWMRGKGFDTFCPIGPVLLTADELAEPAALAAVELVTEINGREVARGTVGDLRIGVAELIARISAEITLTPGTILLTGAPAPSIDLDDRPDGLRAGDEVAVSATAIGRLRCPVR